MTPSLEQRRSHLHLWVLGAVYLVGVCVLVSGVLRNPSARPWLEACSALAPITLTGAAAWMLLAQPKLTWSYPLVVVSFEVAIAVLRGDPPWLVPVGAVLTVFCAITAAFGRRRPAALGVLVLGLMCSAVELGAVGGDPFPAQPPSR